MAEADTTTPRSRSRRAKIRRRRRRVISLVVYGVIVFGLAWFATSRATTTIIFVSHADVNLVAGDDPPLSQAGLARAELLAEFLKDIDVLAGLDAIFADEYKRTQQTAAPIAEAMGIEVQITDHAEIVGFMKQVVTDYKGQIVLVVTRGELIPELVAELHGHQSVPEIGAAEHDNVYIVTSPWFGKVKTLRLRYGLGWKPPASSYGSARADFATANGFSSRSPSGDSGG